MTIEEIFSSSTTYQIILGLIPIILTEVIKSDYNEKNFKNSIFRTTNNSSLQKWRVLGLI
jgi:hypothetical protein